MIDTFRRWTALFAIPALLVAPQASAARGHFPPQIAGSVWWKDLPDDEPMLWRTGAREGFKSRIRLTISGIVRQKTLIRIDETASGGGRGRVLIAMPARRGGGGDLDAWVDHEFSVSRANMAALRALIDQAKMWQFDPQEHWVGAEDDICLDGNQLVFERRDAAGYRFSEGNAQCTIPPRVRAVAARIIELSGERTALTLTR